MKVAITADWMSNVGGGGVVLTHLHALFPEAPIFTTIVDRERLPPHMHGWDVRPSFLQKVPFAKRRYQAFLPLMPLAFEQFDLREYDLIISTNSACAKGVIASPEATHICYCYTPCRYIWDLYHDYTRDLPLRGLIAPVAHWLRVWDRLAADRVDHFVALSHEVAGRVRRHYRRVAEVIHPPVDLDRFEVRNTPPEDFYLVVSRLVPYKRIDLAIAAANELGRRLVIVGDGPMRRRLERLAGPTVEFRGHVEDEVVADLLGRCQALLFPGLEDFGIVMVEAQAAGRPVIAYARGGALDIVRDGSTGILFGRQETSAIVDAMEQAERTSFDPSECRSNAERFHPTVFRDRITAAVQLQREIGRAQRSEALREEAQLMATRSIGSGDGPCTPDSPGLGVGSEAVAKRW